jgi:hypothetical protein
MMKEKPSTLEGWNWIAQKKSESILPYNLLAISKA